MTILLGSEKFRLLLALPLFLLIGCLKLTDKTSKMKYIITETGKYSSLDPLHGDSTSNLPVQRMIYSTILEVSSTDDYQSFILDSFAFDSSKLKLTFKISKTAKFSDGENITSKDIVYSILRMLKARPSYPVLNKIKGSIEWSGNLDVLPEGISYDEENVKIEFTEMNFNPLSRFCMEIFSIIPSRCVDPVTADIECGSIPSSGPYTIDSESESTIVFKKNHFFRTSKDRNFPEVIEFKYESMSEYLRGNVQLENNVVLTSNELYVPLSAIEKLENRYRVTKKPKVRFRALELRPNGIFKDKNCRIEFTRLFRKYAHKVGIEVENSVFTKIMSGYQKFEELPKQKCINKGKVRWGYVRKYEDESDLKSVMSMIAKEDNTFSINSPLVFESDKDYLDAIYSGELDVITPSSGFWAADPAGDIRMYFTPNMHRHLNFITSDPELQKLLTELENDQSPENFIKVNRYLYEDAKFNVYRHAARFYMTNKNVSLKNLPLGITSPAPYTVLEKLSESN